MLFAPNKRVKTAHGIFRDLVREGVRRQKDAGLGDPDQGRHHDHGQAAAGELLREARKLRAVVEAAALR